MEKIKKYKGAIKIALLVIIICAVLLGINYFKQHSFSRKTEITTTEITDCLISISELATYEYDYTAVAKFENHLEFYGYTIPFTTSSFIATYDGTIKAGILMNEVKVYVTGRTITIVLPDTKILSHQIDFDSIEVLDESQSIFNPIKITEYNQFYSDQAKTMEDKAKSKGLLDKAKENAVKVIETYLEQLIQDTDYTINVK